MLMTCAKTTLVIRALKEQQRYHNGDDSDDNDNHNSTCNIIEGHSNGCGDGKVDDAEVDGHVSTTITKKRMMLMKRRRRQ